MERTSKNMQLKSESVKKKNLARSQAFIIPHNSGKLRSILQIAKALHLP